MFTKMAGYVRSGYDDMLKAFKEGKLTESDIIFRFNAILQDLDNLEKEIFKTLGNKKD